MSENQQKKKRKNGNEPSTAGVSTASNHDDAEPREDIVMLALLQNMRAAVDSSDGDLVESSLQVLLGMTLNLPEHGPLRQILLSANIVDHLVHVATAKLVPLGHVPCYDFVEDAARVIYNLFWNQGGGGESRNTQLVVANGVLDDLVVALSGDTTRGSWRVKKLCVLDFDDSTPSGLLTLKSVHPIAKTMGDFPGSPEVQKWGCGALQYILRCHSNASQDVASVFFEKFFFSDEGVFWDDSKKYTSAVEVVIVAMGEVLGTSGRISEAVQAAIEVLHRLKRDFSVPKETLVELGLVQALGEVLTTNRLKRTPEVMAAAEELIGLLVSKSSKESDHSVACRSTRS